MTCIVGYAVDGNVYMGGDSAGVGEGYSLQIRAEEKVFLKGSMIFGFTTSFRMGQLLRYELEIPKHEDNLSDMEYLCSVFIKAVINCFRDNGFLTTSGSVIEGGVFLIGYRGKVYYVDDDFHIANLKTPFTACGCGGQIALGAMEVLVNSGSPVCKPAKAVKRALSAAGAHSAGVSGPYVVKCLGE